MSILLTLVVGLIIAAIVIWAVSAYLPAPQPLKNIIILLLILILVIWLLSLLGVRLG